MAAKISLETKIVDYIRRHDRFTLEELVEEVQSSELRLRRNAPDRILDLLEKSQLVFTDDAQRFVTRRSYFAAACFLITPTEWEAAAKTLFIGHRLVPFIDPNRLPWDCILLDEGTNELGRGETECMVGELWRTCSLLGWEFFPDYLGDLGVGLEGIDAEPNELFERRIMASGVDLSVLLEEERASGSAESTAKRGILPFEVRTLDWEEGRYSIRRLSETEVDERRELEVAWIEAMDAGLGRALDLIGPYVGVPEQLAWAYYFEPRLLELPPALNFGRYLSRSKLVDLRSVDRRAALWFVDGKIPDLGAAVSERGEPRGDDDSLDAILDDVGISLTEEVIEGYMRNELYSGEGKLSRVHALVLGGRSVVFADNEQEHAFFGFIEEMWNRVCAAYRREGDRDAGPVREHVVLVHAQILRWLRGLDGRGIALSRLPQEEVLQLTNASSFLDEMLRLLNDPESIDERSAAETEKSLEQLEGVVNDLIGRIDPKTGGSEEPGDSSSPPARVYTMKVSLQRIRPPIWRRLRIPGDFTLSDLHKAIQIAMGWDESHPHEFRIGQRFYSPAEELGPSSGMLFSFDDDSENEEEVRVDEVFAREKARGYYTYDFGDDWRHLIVVEKIQSAGAISDDDGTPPVCLAGRRAAPPEDSGGEPGYYQLLSALEDDEELPEHLAWLADYDPDTFDRDALNERLRRAFA